nr:hypothetical protein [Tanacetum cinerariifolium]
MDDESNQGRIIDEIDKDDVVSLMDDKEEDKKDEEAKVVENDQVQGRQAESQDEIYRIDMDYASKVLSMQEDEPAEVQEVVDVVTTAKRRKRVVIRDPKEESTTSSIIPAETKSKDKGNNVAGFKLDYFKGMSYDDIHPIFEAKFNSNISFLLKKKEQMEEEENRALQNINETSLQKASKRRKLNEEVEDLKRHLEIVPNEDDDIYTEATPLAKKVPIMDYEIIEINNKPYYKIIRADRTHPLYISFLTLLKNFDRKDLEALWSLVKERFSTSKPKNFFDDFLLTTLGALF